ncbi:MAG: membrane dipeptidase [Xanthomonadales bacterium]|nr:membrane dipeptidase [Xanthomonadales bacterium]NIN60330.1 membrane dipeptidase [Xanthomonadales bacterium]NIN75682.1 membrane dipeptidase [Xanthomonadales bacterium]NIO14755.1 membrane dipeptidase [Xanthomonadales bacterium]NIP12723.1 membrane dipeptidase [Xanthomonadales bacterium]
MRLLRHFGLGALLVGLGSAPPAVASEGEDLERARELARRHLVVDTHIDVPYRINDAWVDVTQETEGGDFDLPRARQGGLDLPFMSIYTPVEAARDGRSFQLANQLIDQVEAMQARAPDQLVLVRTPAEAERAVQAGKRALAMGMENGSPLAGQLGRVAWFRARGISYITLAHSESNDIADSSYDRNRPWQGLSPFGREVVREMNRVGIMVDVSHLSDAAFWQVMEVSEAPVIASHSSARHFTPGFERNMSDEMIAALAANGGVIQINFGSPFIAREPNAWTLTYKPLRDAFIQEHGHPPDGAEAKRHQLEYRAEHPFPYASLEDVLDHFDHVVQLTSVDHVGIGSDFDGVGDSLPVGLKDVSAYPNLVAGLLRRGYSEADIVKILGGNLMRVWRAVLEHAAQAGG